MEYSDIVKTDECVWVLSCHNISSLVYIGSTFLGKITVGLLKSLGRNVSKAKKILCGLTVHSHQTVYKPCFGKITVTLSFHFVSQSFHFEHQAPILTSFVLHVCCHCLQLCAENVLPRVSMSGQMLSGLLFPQPDDQSNPTVCLSCTAAASFLSSSFSKLNPCLPMLCLILHYVSESSLHTPPPLPTSPHAYWVTTWPLESRETE